ncbi:unnamed protein product [Rangifer tarandus platyrhynchus]|uniref:Uncharacterized protein n=2 Tax=Rangifer tarandus platyrhynchus TaxID=3082113 RepID=A0ABN8ZVL8_RANTA|nr:unnamed protein product [Rangifer tarandus platyrhynchus]CAI9711513.1 unnamed protein product [Rangifer tarandus platyrhynchus]
MKSDVGSEKDGSVSPARSCGPGQSPAVRLVGSGASSGEAGTNWVGPSSRRGAVQQAGGGGGRGWGRWARA